MKAYSQPTPFKTYGQVVKSNRGKIK